ncbi:MAG: ribosomal protein S18-alanine N-acetyltransferase [Brevundimonas sp.]|uniref:ribosomal protein S18-alanine N-acetyltransferase n=1 Tax=Brevundimonas sp. TaxID=1871086 RepID=UPI0025BCE224|nr:ribosomal protein S18-alanine N-acetyltransferase [Brevundimonas sp.]MBX3478165.1 ribosomal protein S18-alanine N-acetyltransferase [Brevundimonas sp.]
MTRPADLAALHAQAFATSWTAEAFADLLDQAGVFVEAEDGGFILVRVVADEAEILTLAVRPQARRQGVATRLVQAAAGRAAGRGGRRLFLEVAETNDAARGLYERCGFDTVGRRRAYYADPKGGPAVDALILARVLGD